jgi:hypothetical protein
MRLINNYNLDEPQSIQAVVPEIDPEHRRWLLRARIHPQPAAFEGLAVILWTPRFIQGRGTLRRIGLF